MFDGDRVEHKTQLVGHWTSPQHFHWVSCGDCWIRNPHHVEPSADRLANQLVDRSCRPRFGISPILVVRVLSFRCFVKFIPRSEKQRRCWGHRSFGSGERSTSRLVARGLTVAAGFALAHLFRRIRRNFVLPRRADTLTGPQAVLGLLSTPGDLLRGQAMALSVVLALAVATAVIFPSCYRFDDHVVARLTCR